MSASYERVRAARARTTAEGTARIWTASIDDALAGGDPPFESTGLVNFNDRSASIASRASEAQTRWLLELAQKAADGRPGHELPTLQEALDITHESLFIGDQHYSRSASNEYWVRDKCEWWEHPLLALDSIAAASTDVRAEEAAEVRGRAATKYAGTIDRDELERLEPGLVRGLLGRRSRQKIAIRVWLDEDDRALRIWWALVPPPKKAALTWTATEFWDFGTEVALTAPSDEVSHPPPTSREIIRDLRAMRKHATD